MKFCKLGVARTFQNIRLFSQLSVLDNVKTGLHNQITYSFAESMFHLGSYRKKEKQMDEKALELLRVFDLDGVADYKAANLPYGKQRKLEIARALATNPKLLLLDEPAAGMNPNETEELMETIRNRPQEVRRNRPAHRARHEAGLRHLRVPVCAQLRPSAR